MTPPRVVSTIASATEIVHRLGLLDRLVGRSHECDHPPEVLKLPVCTAPAIDVSGSSADIDRRVRETAANALSIYRVFDDVLEELQPTHILTQTQCEVCAVSLADVERALSRRLTCAPEIVSLNPDSMEEIRGDIRRVATTLGVPNRGETAVAEMDAELMAIAGRAREFPSRPTIACLEWIEPLMAAGNWNPELVEIAGGTNLFGEAGRHSPWMTFADLRDTDPDVILVMPCGFDIERTLTEMPLLTRKEGWEELGAVRRGAVFVADGNQYFNRPGPRLTVAARILLEVLHPGARDPEVPTPGYRRY